MDFLLGTAIICLPPQHQVPLALATAAALAAAASALALATAAFKVGLPGR